MKCSVYVDGSGRSSENCTRLIPLIKPASYINHVVDIMDDTVASLPLDNEEEDSISLVLVDRCQSLNEEISCFHDLVVFSDISKANTLLSIAFENISDDILKFELIQGVLLKVNGANPLPKLVLKSFLYSLKTHISDCESVYDLIVVPLSENILYATISTNFQGCCMLGDLTCQQVAPLS